MSHSPLAASCWSAPRWACEILEPLQSTGELSLAAAFQHLFVVQQTLGGGKADVLSLELRGLVQVVELQAGSRHRGLEHFLLPVVDGDLQVAQVGLQRRSHDLRRRCCKQVAQFRAPVEN